MASPIQEKQVAINKEAVKTLVEAIGLRPAARQLGLNENTVLQWSNRDPNGSWVSPAKPGPLSNQSVIVSPSEALKSVLSENSGKIKLSLSKAAVAASRSLEGMSGSRVLKQSRPMKDIAGTASLVHGWEEKQAGAGTLQLNILANQAAVMIQSDQD